MPEFESEIPKEEVTQNPEEKEPTPQELAEACKEVLDEETCAELETMEFNEALGYAFTCLMEAGIEDTEEFLIKKGILEKTKEQSLVYKYSKEVH